MRKGAKEFRIKKSMSGQENDKSQSMKLPNMPAPQPVHQKSHQARQESFTGPPMNFLNGAMMSKENFQQELNQNSDLQNLYAQFVTAYQMGEISQPPQNGKSKPKPQKPKTEKKKNSGGQSFKNRQNSKVQKNALEKVKNSKSEKKENGLSNSSKDVLKPKERPRSTQRPKKGSRPSSKASSKGSRNGSTRKKHKHSKSQLGGKYGKQRHASSKFKDKNMSEREAEILNINHQRYKRRGGKNSKSKSK